MKLLELDAHPLMESFRILASDMKGNELYIYHLLLPPEYNIPADMMDPLLYLFFEKIDNQGIYIQYKDNNLKLKSEGSKLTPLEGFDHSESIEVLQTTPCTTSAGFSFDMHEVSCNPFMPSPIPPLCFEIEDGYTHPANAMSFIKTRIRSEKLPPLLDKTENMASKASITSSNYQSYVSNMQDTMDQICDIVFDVRPFHFIPTVFKMKTNFIIFYAVTNLFHMKLLPAYHEAMREDNLNAESAAAVGAPSIADPAKLDEAAAHLTRLHRMNSVADGIAMVQAFFEGVVAALPDANAAADDILPAVIDGMSRCGALARHIVSSFTYLAEVWPQEGLSERITYILVTCSIAASHFACGVEGAEAPKPPRHTIDVAQVYVDETIKAVEDYLDTL